MKADIKINSSTAKGQSGFVLIALLIATVAISLISVATAQLAVNNLQRSTVEHYRLNTQFASDAGLDKAVQSLNDDNSWTGSGGQQTILEDSKIKVTYETTVTDDADDTVKYVTVTGRTYSPINAAEPRLERKYQIKLRGVTGGNFSVVTGVGGLIMSNSAKIVGGNVFVNGEINMSNTAQIGLSTNPVNVKAAHQNCPAAGGSSYPRACASNENGQPINLNNSAKIYGEVRANNQTNGASMFDPGLVSGTVTPAALPTHDRNALVSAISTTRTGSDAGCSSGTKTWAANTKITGNVTISNSCKVTVLGDVWITGALTVQNSGQLIVSNSLTSPPVLMIDGSTGLVAKNSALLQSNTNSTPIGFRIITYWSSASCSPGCSDVTGNDLYNSRNTTTISLDNSAAGPQTEFYARWSRVQVNNGGNIGAVVGQTVELKNSGAITFGGSVSGVSEIEAWVIESYKRTF